MTESLVEKELHVLILEDVPSDAELMERELRRAGLKFSARRVETREDFIAALEAFAPDLVLADHRLPAFDGLSALRIVRERSRELPFIFVTSAMGEEVAIETLLSGATDYVLKDRLSKLVPAVERAFREVEELVQRRRAEEALRLSEARLRRQAEQLAETDRRKDEFLATLAHELRNPLAPISNAVQLLRRSGASPAMVESALGMAERQVGQLMRLVDDLLDISRITRGKITLHKAWVTLQAVVQSALETSRPQIKAAGHRLTVEMPEEPIYLEADLTRLAQAVSNLLSNAAKFTEAGGHIRLWVHCEGREALITVQDTGVGIPAAQLPEVFELFTQGKQSPGYRQGGLGIGLALVKSLAEMHGGHVEAASAGLGQGSTFTVRLPLCAEQSGRGAADEAHGTAAAPQMQARSILVVDDNADVANSMAMLLETYGHQVRVAYDGATALGMACEHPPEVALLDIGMPSMDGYEVARRLRQQPELQGMVLVALTGWGQEADRQRSREAGFDHHLVKPVDMATLEALLERGTQPLNAPPDSTAWT